MKSAKQMMFPALAAKNNYRKAACLEYSSDEKSVSLLTGTIADGQFIRANSLAKELEHFLTPAIEFVDDEHYIVMLSCGKEFGLWFWLCRANDDSVIKTGELSDVGSKCGSLSIAPLSYGCVIVWESWGEDGIPQLKSCHFGAGGEAGGIRTITPKGVSANWPSAVIINDKLWVSFCVPNVEKNGYDCILAEVSDKEVTYWRLNDGLDGLYHMYPSLSLDSKDQLWIIWLRETEQEHYHLTGQIADSAYCCMQDSLSRARRKILWNATEPVVMKLKQDGNQIIAESFYPSGHERGPKENQTIHYPSLCFADNNCPIMIFDRYYGGGCFQTSYSLLGKFGSDDGILPICSKVAYSFLPQPVKNRTAICDGQLLAIQEDAPVIEGKRNCPDTSLAIASHTIDNSDFILQPSAEYLLSPMAPVAADSSSGKDDAFFGNIHIHTEISRCRRDTQQSLDFNYRWAKDLMEHDFVAITDHEEDMSQGHWLYCLGMADFFNFPGHYVSLPAYEWARMSPDGHMNVFFRNNEDAFMQYSDQAVMKLAELWDSLRNYQAITIAHHTGTYPFQRDWQFYDSQLEPIVEIFQDRRGNYEYPTAPWFPGDACPEQGQESKVSSGFVCEALKRGYKLGFCSGGDHMGLSMTGIYCDELTREALFDAMKMRMVFGASKPGISIDISALCGDSNVKMGGTLKVVNGDTVGLAVAARAYSEIDYIALIHDQKEYCRIDGDGVMDIATTLEISEPADYLYARVRLSDGNMAWSSPIWFEPTCG